MPKKYKFELVIKVPYEVSEEALKENYHKL